MSFFKHPTLSSHDFVSPLFPPILFFLLTRLRIAFPLASVSIYTKISCSTCFILLHFSPFKIVCCSGHVSEHEYRGPRFQKQNVRMTDYYCDNCGVVIAAQHKCYQETEHEYCIDFGMESQFLELSNIPFFRIVHLTIWNTFILFSWRMWRNFPSGHTTSSIFFLSSFYQLLCSFTPFPRLISPFNFFSSPLLSSLLFSST